MPMLSETSSSSHPSLQTAEGGLYYPGDSNIQCSQEDLEEMVRLYGGDFVKREYSSPSPSPSSAKSIEGLAMEIVR